MILCKPVVCRRLQEASDLAPGVHEVTASPFTDAHVLMRIFVQGGSVIIGEGVIVYGKMNRYKIQDNADLILMAFVDEFH